MDIHEMDNQEISRRLFVIQSCATLGAAWLMPHVTEVLAAGDHVHRRAASKQTGAFEFFTPKQAAEVEAISSQIIPTDDTPGAREARVVYFIDRALATFAVAERGAFLKGLKQVGSKSKKMFKAERFSTLNAEQQVKVLKEIEKEPFFEMVRVMTIIGMFSNPEYGGNHDQAGWKLIGFEDQFFFKPPFGHYDAEVGAVKNGDAELCAEGSIQDQTLTSTF